jgi:HEAT repeat protein
VKRSSRRLHRRILQTTVAVPLTFAPLFGCSERDSATSAKRPALESVSDEDLRAEIGRLQSATDTKRIIDSIEELRSDTSPASIPFLAPFIRHPDEQVALAAVEAIEFLSIATTDGIPVLSEALESNVSPTVKRRIVEALYEQRTEVGGGMVLVEPLIGVLESDPDPMVRVDAARHIGALGEVEAIPALRKRLDAEKDDRVRQSVDWAIRYLRDETGEPPPSFAPPA